MIMQKIQRIASNNKMIRVFTSHRDVRWVANKRTITLGLLFIVVSSFVLWKPQKPTLYIIGDSTVKNGDGTGKDKYWGWGSFMANRFDTVRIHVQNHAIGGRSSRTFITDGRWD